MERDPPCSWELREPNPTKRQLDNVECSTSLCSSLNEFRHQHDFFSAFHFLYFANHHNLRINHKLVKNYIFYLMPMFLSWNKKIKLFSKFYQLIASSWSF